MEYCAVEGSSLSGLLLPEPQPLCATLEWWPMPRTEGALAAERTALRIALQRAGALPQSSKRLDIEGCFELEEPAQVHQQPNQSPASSLCSTHTPRDGSFQRRLDGI